MEGKKCAPRCKMKKMHSPDPAAITLLNNHQPFGHPVGEKHYNGLTCSDQKIVIQKDDGRMFLR